MCTNGKRDQCCALRGRPVAGAIADGTDWDTWECSHLGGHRFAATMMLLPTGDMFGWLDEESAVEVTRRFDAGLLVLPHYRGRCGQPEQVQAALHAAALRLGDSRRGVLAVSGVRPSPAGPGADAGCARGGRRAAEAEVRWEVDVVHQAGPRPGGRLPRGAGRLGAARRRSCPAGTVFQRLRLITRPSPLPAWLNVAAPPGNHDNIFVTHD